MRYITLLILFILSSEINLAQENDSKYILTGAIELDHYSFLKEKDNYINSRNQSTLQLELKSKFSNHFSFFSELEFRHDFSDDKRNRIFLKETYIDLFTDKIDLRVGKQIILWGKADGFNPTGNISSMDYSDILDTDGEELGVFALNTKVYLKDWEIQGIIIPAFQASIFPSEKSRWLEEYPDYLYHNGLNKPVLYFWNNANIPDNKLKDIQYALKLSRNFSSVDLSISYYNGWNDIPSIVSSITPSDNDTILANFNQYYYRHQVVGADFSTAIGKFILKGEGALFIPNNAPLNNPYFQYVLGVERTFSNLIKDNNMHVILQWIHEIKSKKVNYSGSDFNHLFQKNLMARIEMEINRNMVLSLQGIYSLKYNDFYLKPEFKYNITDGVNLSFLVDIIGGNEAKNGFFSKYRDNTRIQAKLKYDF